MSTKQSTKAQSQKAKQAARQAALTSAGLNTSSDARKQAQTERQRVVAEEAARRNRRHTTRNRAIILALILLMGGGLAYMFVTGKAARDVADARARDFAANPPGELVPQQQSPHIATVSTAHEAYSTDPPTSGPHIPQVPAWGVHTQEIPKELQVHALEDAGVVINYRPGLDQATVDRLAALTVSYSKFAQDDQSGHVDNHVLLAPYTNLDHPIVVTAWRRIARLDGFDEARIKRFIEAYKNIDHHGDSGS